MIGAPLQFLSEDKQSDSLLPWVIAVMLFLSALATACAVGIGSGLATWSKGLASNLTVQIVEADETDRTRQTQAALILLNATPGIEKAEVMADSYVISLLSPWLGDLPMGAGLPLPTLIDVKLTNANAVNLAGLKERLAVAAPAAQVDDHQAWMNQILDLASMLQIVLGAIVIMVALCTVAIVIFGCRAGLASHQDSIEIMHMMGAEDALIARAFDDRYLRHGLKGGLVGVFIAGLTLFAIARLAESMGQGLLNAAMPQMSTLWWLLIMPVIAALITMMTARLTVRSALKEMM